MYIEQLVTPHPQRFPEESPRPFMAAAGLYSTPNSQGEKPPTTVDRIQQIVRDTFDYPRHDSDWIDGPDADPLESMLRHGQTNCIGYTMAGSEAISTASPAIAHYIAYGRGHFFLLTPQPSPTGDRLFSRDMLLPEFNGDVTDSIHYGTAASIARALAAQPERQHNVALNTHAFARFVGMTPRELASAYKLLWGNQSATAPDVHNPQYGSQEDDGHDPHLNRSRFMERFKWILSLYTPETGRQVLQHYASFTHAVRVGNVGLAVTSSERLAGRFPENDCRTRHDLIKSLVGQMCLDATYRGEISDVIQAYCSSIRTGDPRAVALEADLHRKAAQITGDLQSAEKAISAYQAAQQMTRVRGFGQACRDKSRKLAAIAGNDDHYSLASPA